MSTLRALGTPTPELRPTRSAIPGSAATAPPTFQVRVSAAARPRPASDRGVGGAAVPAAAPKKQPAASSSKPSTSPGSDGAAGSAAAEGSAEPAKPAKSTGAAKAAGAAKPARAARTAKPAGAGKTARTAKTSKSNGAAAARATTKANGAAAKTTTKSRSRKKTTTAARRPRLQYKVGQQLVYPLQGVGQVTTIEERPFRDETLLYYVVYLEVSDMTIMVPVGKADELGIRAIVPRPEANGALRLIGEDYEPIPTDWKLRYQMNLDLLKAGSVSDIATVVRALYHRSRIKELPILERKLYDNARSLLVDELSFSLGKDKGTIEEMINSRLEAGVKP